MSAVEQVTVSLYATHTWDSDLVFDLTSPTATTVRFIFLAGSSNNNFGTSAADADRTTLDDAAAVSINASPSNAPFVGSWQPTNPLSAFNGETAEGGWTLAVYDRSAGDTGTLQAASVFVTSGSVETRYDITGLPAAIPDNDLDVGLQLPFTVTAPWSGEGGDGVGGTLWPYDTMTAGFLVRIVPLFKGVPGEVEGAAAAGLTTIDEADTFLVEQYSDLEVNHDLNSGRTGGVTLSMYDPIHALVDLQPFEQAVWIGYRRPNHANAECVLFGQCNVSRNFKDGTIRLDIADPVMKTQHHYIRRGDDALNVDKDRGRLRASALSIDTIIQAARNIPAQQTRAMPGLAMKTVLKGLFADAATAPFIDFERFQEVWDLCQQIFRSALGPDVDVRPNWGFPATTAYAFLTLYDPPTDPASPTATELGRNLDPADPDAPAPGEVMWDWGQGLDNLEDLQENPGVPKTHWHVYDTSKRYRESSADATSSGKVGAWVGAIEADVKINPPHRAFLAPAWADDIVPADTSPLKALADAKVNAYGVPPKYFTLVPRPDDAMTHHYGHPDWAAIFDVDGNNPGGQWYIGDYVRVRATEGYYDFSTLARIVAVKLSVADSNGLPRVEPSMIPAISGAAGDSDETG